MRRISTVLVLVALAATTACQDQEAGPVGPEGTVAISSTAASSAGPSVYEVTVTNLTDGQPLTPPLAVTHRQRLSVFEVGEAASLGVREIAENGNLGPLDGALAGDKHLSDLVIALPSDPLAPPPILPLASRTFMITADSGFKHFSFVSMLICTNDGFTGLASARLPQRVGDTSDHELVAYDAGSEMNTEDLDDMVPPCGKITLGLLDPLPGTGMSDPALAEGGVIGMHAGIVGGVDLVTIHEWDDPVATVSITRVH